MVKFKELTVLDLVKIQSQLARRLSLEQEVGSLSIEEYAVNLIEVMKDRFDFSSVEGIKSFDDAKNDMACVEEMIKISLGVLERIGEVYKKKTLLRTPTMPTQETSSEKSSQG